MTLEQIFERALESFRSPAVEQRFPYTYADDFVRLHPEIIPSAYVREPIDSRAGAGLAIERWAKAIDVSTEQLASTLAGAYMIEFHLYSEDIENAIMDL